MRLLIELGTNRICRMQTILHLYSQQLVSEHSGMATKQPARKEKLWKPQAVARSGRRHDAVGCRNGETAIMAQAYTRPTKAFELAFRTWRRTPKSLESRE